MKNDSILNLGLPSIEKKYNELYQSTLMKLSVLPESLYKEQHNCFLEYMKKDFTDEFSIISDQVILEGKLQLIFDQYRILVEVAISNENMFAVFGLLTKILDELKYRASTYVLQNFSYLKTSVHYLKIPKFILHCGASESLNQSGFFYNDKGDAYAY